MNQNGYINSIIGVEIMSVLVCLVLLYGNLFEHREKTRRNRIFSWAIVSCMLALIADAISWIFDGNEALEPLLYASTLISLVMTFVLDGIFISYITEYVCERKPVSKLLQRIYMVFAAIAVAAIAATSGSGALFSFENGYYLEGPYYSVYLIVNLLCSVFCLLTNLINMRFLSVHDRMATMSFIVFPWVAGVINLFHEEFSYAYPAVVLSLAMLYIMVQSERQDRLEEEGRISFYHARHDPLTGLANRLAYEERLQELSTLDDKAAAVFTDVNGLKYANDNFGHEAGDRLLTEYAELLCRHFRKADVFRISGDEFTILLEKVDEETFHTRMKAFRKALCEKGPAMASIGFTFGNSWDIHSLIKEAETGMYEDKEQFHKEHPKLGRH